MKYTKKMINEIDLNVYDKIEITETYYKKSKGEGKYYKKRSLSKGKKFQTNNNKSMYRLINNMRKIKYNI